MIDAIFLLEPFYLNFVEKKTSVEDNLFSQYWYNFYQNKINLKS
jgi:hypothetical protein